MVISCFYIFQNDHLSKSSYNLSPHKGVESPLGCVLLFVALWTIAHQAPLSMRFSRQEHWSGLSCIPPGDLPDPGMEPMSLTSPALSGSIAIFPNIITPSSTRFDVKYFESLLEFVKDLCTFHQPSPFSKAMFLQ